MVTRDRSSWPGWARALTTGWVLSPVIVLALLVATFEGYGYYTRHQKTTYSRGGAFGGGDAAAAATTHSGKGGGAHHQAKQGAGSALHGGGGSGGSGGAATGGGGHAGALGGGGGGGGSTTTTTSTTTHSGGSQHHGTGGGPGPSSAPAPGAANTGLGTPTSGVYGLAVTGSESAKFGPFSACHNSYPSRATLDVHHASGESPSAYDFDMRLYPGSPNKHDERHIYNYSKNAVSLTYEQETVTCSGVKQATNVSYSPAQTRVEGPLAVGKSWHNHGGGSSRTETGTSNVTKRTTLTVQGKTYTVYEIVTKLKMTGSETGERDQTWWYAPSVGMPLKFSESLHGKRSGASYSEAYTATVVTMP